MKNTTITFEELFQIIDGRINELDRQRHKTTSENEKILFIGEAIALSELRFDLIGKQYGDNK